MGDPAYSPLWSGGLLEDPLWSPPFDHTLPNTSMLFAPPSPYNSTGHFNPNGGMTTRIDRFGREVRCFYGCQPVFHSDEQLQQHVMKQHEISRCQYGCEPVFDRFDALRQHVAEQHEAEREGTRYSSLLFQPRLLRPDVSCFYGCGPTFRDEEQLREHVRQQHEISKCQFGCGPRFERFEQLQEHVYSSHAPGNPISLSPIFSDNRDGTMTDRQGNTYVCHYDSCGRAFPVLTQLSQHRAQTHHEQTLVSSPTLGASMMDPTPDSFDNLPLPSLESLVGVQNMSSQGSPSPATKVKSEQGSEAEHSNHGHSWDGKCHSVLSSSSAAAHRCEKCGSTFKENTNLTRHQEQAHRGKKEHVCDYCHTPFGRKSNLKTHVDTVHFQKRRFGCEKCGQRFTQKGNLATHFRTKHLGRRDFICESCGQSFARNETRRVHVRIVHEKRKDFVCSHCPGKGFATKSNLVRHVKAHHGEDVASAIVKPKPEPIVLIQK